VIADQGLDAGGRGATADHRVRIGLGQGRAGERARHAADGWKQFAGDEFTVRMFEAINGMLLDMLAAVARKDYDDRRRRQAQGQAKAKAEGRYKGRRSASR
jgi:hypothetical protein